MIEELAGVLGDLEIDAGDILARDLEFHHDVAVQAYEHAEVNPRDKPKTKQQKDEDKRGTIDPSRKWRREAEDVRAPIVMRLTEAIAGQARFISIEGRNHILPDLMAKWLCSLPGGTLVVASTRMKAEQAVDCFARNRRTAADVEQTVVTIEEFWARMDFGT